MRIISNSKMTLSVLKDRKLKRKEKESSRVISLITVLSFSRTKRQCREQGKSYKD
jgi:hypothetical protein